MQPEAKDTEWCIEAATRIVDNLVNQARRHGDELYWDAGFADRSAGERRTLEASIGFGTPGILLFLAEYYAIQRDERIPVCIQACLPRVLRLIERAPVDGFYTGAAGAVYALMRVGDLMGTPLMVAPSIVASIVSRVISSKSTGGSLANGHAGTLLGLELLHPRYPQIDIVALRKRLLESIAADMFAFGEGLVCGRQYDAIRMPVGFYAGSSGIRYVLDQYGAPGLEWLSDGLASYEASAYLHGDGCWKDFVNEEFFSDPRNAAMINAAFEKDDLALFSKAGATCGWGAGTVGILLAGSRSRTCPNDDSSARAVEAVDMHVRQQVGKVSPFTLFAGLGGIGWCASQLNTLRPANVLSEISRMTLAAAKAQFLSHRRLFAGSWEKNAPLGLLNGEAGFGLYLVAAAAGAPSPSPLFPALPRNIPIVDPDMSVDAMRERLMRRHFGLTGKLRSLRLPDKPTRFAIEGAAAISCAGEDALATDVCEYETARLRAESEGPPGIMLACRESYNDEFRTQRLDRSTHRETMQWKLKLVPFAKLGLLPFGLPINQNESVAAGQDTLLLRFFATDGVREVILTPAMYQVLSQMRTAIRVERLIQRSCGHWPFDTEMPQSVERQVLDIVRAGILSGYVVSAD